MTARTEARNAQVAAMAGFRGNSRAGRLAALLEFAAAGISPAAR